MHDRSWHQSGFSDRCLSICFGNDCQSHFVQIPRFQTTTDDLTGFEGTAKVHLVLLSFANATRELRIAEDKLQKLQDPNLNPEHGQSAKWFASTRGRGHAEIACLPLERKLTRIVAEVSLAHHCWLQPNTSPFWTAVFGGHVGVARLLLEARANTEHRRQDGPDSLGRIGATPLWIAS